MCTKNGFGEIQAVKTVPQAGYQTVRGPNVKVMHQSVYNLIATTLPGCTWVGSEYWYMECIVEITAMLVEQAHKPCV